MWLVASARGRLPRRAPPRLWQGMWPTILGDGPGWRLLQGALVSSRFTSHIFLASPSLPSLLRACSSPCVVLVKKSNEKWRVCIDYTNLNKACPKDSYPLLSIDQLVDATSGFSLISFMDAFSRYNQICMAEKDEEKTTFIANWAIYCYKVMPFSLKNARATYQRLVNKIFSGQLRRNMEAYVDDMLVKSKTIPQHISNLEETFLTLRAEHYDQQSNQAQL